GAQATLTYLLDSYDYMMSSGDTSVWEDSVDPECQVCGRFLDNAQVLDEQGGYLAGGSPLPENVVECTSKAPPTRYPPCIRRRSPATASRRRPGPWSPSSL